jgi:hypothetical protein
MTGLPRKQVHEIKKSLASGELESVGMLSPLADLLQRWATSAEYQDQAGQPTTLTMHDDSTRSFSSLVRSCMGDVPPGAVKTELLRLGAIGVTTEDSLYLTRRSLIPADIDSRLESAVVYSLTGLANTIAHNCDPHVRDSDRFFERFVESPLMSESDIARFRWVLRARLKEISEELDSFLTTNTQADEREKNRRIGIGLYYSE